VWWYHEPWSQASATVLNISRVPSFVEISCESYGLKKCPCTTSMWKVRKRIQYKFEDLSVPDKRLLVNKCRLSFPPPRKPNQNVCCSPREIGSNGSRFEQSSRKSFRRFAEGPGFKISVPSFEFAWFAVSSFFRMQSLLNFANVSSSIKTRMIMESGFWLKFHCSNVLETYSFCCQFARVSKMQFLPN
jgi:hypothetical protein